MLIIGLENGKTRDQLKAFNARLIKQETLKVSGSTFTRALDNLIKCGYVTEYTRNYEHRNPLYIQLIDPFLLFHFHFLSKGEKQLTSYDDFRSNNS